MNYFSLSSLQRDLLWFKTELNHTQGIFHVFLLGRNNRIWMKTETVLIMRKPVLEYTYPCFDICANDKMYRIHDRRKVKAIEKRKNRSLIFLILRLLFHGSLHHKITEVRIFQKHKLIHFSFRNLCVRGETLKLRSIRMFCLAVLNCFLPLGLLTN